MRRKVESFLVGVMTLSAAAIVLLMPVHAFISTWLGTAIGPLLFWKSWKEILLVLMVPVMVWLFILRPDIWKTISGRVVNKIIILYALLHLALIPYDTAFGAAIVAGLLINLRFLAIFLLVQVIVEAHPEYLKRVKNLIPRWLLWVGVGLGILAILQVFVLPKEFLAQFGYDKNTTIAPYILVDENPNALRAFATMRGPNTLGAFMMLPVAVAIYAIYQSRRDILAWAAGILGVVAIYLTGSRSAWLGLLAAIMVLALVELPRRQVIKWTKVLIVPMIILALAIGWTAAALPSVRLAVFHSSPGDSSLTEGSSAKHWESTLAGIMDVVRHPLGSGPGSAGPATFYNSAGTNLSENYYVQVAQEVGLIGLALFVAICIYTVRAIVRHGGILPAALVASFAGISLINIFLHGWADDPTSLVWWALAALFVHARPSHSADVP